MFGIRAAIPATSRLNVIKYANLASLLQTNELLGNYRNLFWFGSPIGLPLVEWTAAVVYGGVLTFAFCWVFARAQLLSASKRGFLLGLRHKTHATSVYKEEARKLLLLNGAALVLAAFAGFGIYQGVTAESYIGPDEIYYAYYMKVSPFIGNSTERSNSALLTRRLHSVILADAPESKALSSSE